MDIAGAPGRRRERGREEGMGWGKPMRGNWKRMEVGGVGGDV